MGITMEMDPGPLIIVASFEKLGMDIRSFKEPLERSVKEVIAPSLQKNFDVMGRPDRWQELAEATYAIKSRLGFGNASRILMRTGLLRRVAGQLNAWDIDGQEGIAKMALPRAEYGYIHQNGAGSGGNALYRRKSRTTGRIVETEVGSQGYVPQRIWALIQKEDEANIEKVFGKWLDDRVKAFRLTGRGVTI
jgi:phage gpG-like protein